MGAMQAEADSGFRWLTTGDEAFAAMAAAIRKARQALEKMQRTSSERNRRILAVKIKKLARMERTLPNFCLGTYDILGG